jgi:ABC-type glycerol-3-phosphate transport system substrate-binding protein
VAISAGALLTVAALALTGCSSSSSAGSASTSTNLKADKGQTINVLAEDIGYTDNWKKLLPTFEKETGITVKIQTVPYASQSSKILLNFSQKSSAYDVVQNDNTFGPGYYKAGYIANLAPYEKAGSKLNTFASFYQPYLAPSQTNGATFGLPVYGETTWLMYRKDLFAQDGISGPPKTMDELEADAKIISEKNGIAGITLRGAPGIQSVYPWSGFLRAFGGDYYTNGKLDVHSPAAVKATTFWADLLKNYGPAGVANFGWQENRIAFTDGKAGMTIDAIANGPFNEDASASKIAGKVGYASIPYAISNPPTSGNTNNSLDVHDLFLSSYSKHKDAAYKFMAWATSPSVQTTAVKAADGIGVTSTAALNSADYKSAYGQFQATILANLKTGNPEYLPTASNANAIITDVGQALSEVLSGQQTADQALKTAQTTLSQ